MSFRFFSLMVFISAFLLPSSAWAGITAPAITKTTTNLGLAGYWAFNEGTGTSASDFSGNGNSGTLTNMASPATSTSGWTKSGRHGQGISFDGSNDYVISSLDGTTLTATTISLWVKPRSVPAGQVGIFQWANILNSGNPFVLISLDSTNGLRAYVDSGYRMTTGALPAGVWSHVTLTLSTGNIWRLYVNGVQVSTYVDDANHSFQLDAASVYLGNGYNAYFPGSVDEVRVYNRELSNSEILKLFRSSAVFKKAGSSAMVTVNKTMKNIIPSGLIGFWPFDGKHTIWAGTNQTSDLSGNGHTADLIGMSPARTPAIGKVGQALLFDGIDDNVDPLDSNDFDLNVNSKYTWSMWLKPNAFANLRNVWAQYDNSGINFLVISAHTTSDANYGPVTKGVTVSWANTAGSNFLIAHTADNVLDVSRWNHVTVTYDGALPQANRFKIFIDGIDQTATGDIYSNGTIFTINPDILNIGGEPGGQFNGAIDEVRFYGRNLSAREISTIFCNCLQP